MLEEREALRKVQFKKQLGGATQVEAVNHYEQTDKVNAELVLSYSAKANLTLELTSDGQLRKI